MQAKQWISKKIIHCTLDSKNFSKNALTKCLYWYADKFEISFELNNKGFYEISLTPKSDNLISELSEISKKLNQDLIDYNLRDIVSKETNTIRELIIAKAFSHGEFDEEPSGELEDPIGIKFL